MAPRARPRKPRLTRMDAAVDAMRPFGFPGKLVRRRVNDLLKEYGGDEGWPFIEADAYKLLIDTILDEQEEEVNGEKCSEGENLMQDDSLNDERAGDCSVEADAGPSGRVLALVYSKFADTAAQTIETEGRDSLLPAEVDRKGWKDICLDQNRNEKDAIDAIGKDDDDSGQAVQLDNNPLQLPPPTLPSPQPADNLPTIRRKPCYGWISSDGEEDEFLELTPAVRLTPAKPSGQPDNLISAADKQRKRKTSWDHATPED